MAVTYNVILLQCFSRAPALPSCQNPSWTSGVSPLLSPIQDPFLYLFFSISILHSYIMSQLRVPSLYSCYSFSPSPPSPLPQINSSSVKKKKKKKSRPSREATEHGLMRTHFFYLCTFCLAHLSFSPVIHRCGGLENKLVPVWDLNVPLKPVC